LYAVDVNKSITSTFIAQNKYQSVMFGIWHRHIGYAGTNTICEMVKDKLVDGLTVKTLDLTVEYAFQLKAYI